MRPTVYGRQLAYNSKGEFCGCNLGYNFYAEHENGTSDLVMGLNSDTSKVVRKIQESGASVLRANSKFKKIIKENEKKIARWRCTPFKDYVLAPHVNYLVRNIIIRNTDLYSKYKRFLLNNGNYRLLLLTSGFNLDSWKKRLGQKRIFSEEDLFYMPDYNYISNNVLNSSSNSVFSEFGLIAGQWGSHGIMLLVGEKIKFYYQDWNIIDQIVDALERGCLAIAPEEHRMFNDRGCCLIILDKSYGV